MKIKSATLPSVLLALIVTFLTACQSAHKSSTAEPDNTISTAPAQPTPLGDYLWRLIELKGEKPADSQNPIGPHLIFLEDEERIAGSTGCNRLMGSYATTTGGAFTFGELATTKMACPNMEGEAAFLKALSETDRGIVGASRIRLLNEAGDLIALFEARSLP